MIADLHTHAMPASRDSRMDVEALARAAGTVGLEALALTDHGQGQDYTAARASLANAGVALITGREISTALGHVLVFSTDEAWLGALPERCALPLDSSPRGPIALVWAHPAGWRVAGTMIPPDASAGAEHLHGVEVLNGERLYQEGGVEIAAELANAYGLAQVGGSDAHDVSLVGRCVTDVPGARDAAEFIEGLAARRSRALLGRAWAELNSQDYRRADLQTYL